MSTASQTARLLRWYPPAWRARYGDELAALMEDSFGHNRIPLRSRLGTARAGLVERWRAGGLGDRDNAPERARAGSLLVLCGWAFFVVVAAIPIKFNEHWQVGTPRPDRWLPQAGQVIGYAGLAVGVLLLAVAGLICLPALFQAWRSSGWPLFRRHVLRLAAVGTIAVAGVIGLAAWAHMLTQHQRNGGFDGYTAAFFVVCALIALTLAVGTASLVSITTKLELSNRAVVALSRLALAMMGVLVLIAAGIGIWWGGLAVHASSVIGGTVPTDLAVDAALSLIGLTIGAVGTRRVLLALPHLTT